MTYTPRAAQAAILDRAWDYVQSVPYRVSLRWLFYRLLQDGTYSDKDAYRNTFKSLLARARKEFYGGWRPDTLADETRTAVVRGLGYADAMDWLRGDMLRRGCKLDRWQAQPRYVEVWFEARAMQEQFTYYTEYIPLRPFGGDPSLDYKWQIVEHFEWMAERYPDKPLVALYFGDLDPKGQQIPETACEDVRTWCSAPFEFVRCGLNPGDEVRYSLPENFEKPGTYQWEALGDDDARDLILDSVGRFVDFDAMAQVEAEEAEITERFHGEVRDLVAKWEAT